MYHSHIVHTQNAPQVGDLHSLLMMMMVMREQHCYSRLGQEVRDLYTVVKTEINKGHNAPH